MCLQTRLCVYGCVFARTRVFLLHACIWIWAISCYPQGKHVNRFGYHWEDWLDSNQGFCVCFCVCPYTCVCSPNCMCLCVWVPIESVEGEQGVWVWEEGELGGLWLIHRMGLWLSLSLSLSLSACIATAVQKLKHSGLKNRKYSVCSRLNKNYKLKVFRPFAVALTTGAPLFNYLWDVRRVWLESTCGHLNWLDIV